ncbi:MAG: GNAT family N-acetyltransferase [Acidimicrobiia bacterium]
MITPVNIRAADAADVGALASVPLNSALAAFAHIFPAAMPKPTRIGLEKEWLARLADPEQTVLVAETEDSQAGVVAYGLTPEVAIAGGILTKLYVAPEHEGRGIGSRLHDEAVAGLRVSGCTSAHLWVLERNIAARRMYLRRGWKLQPRSKNLWPGSGILELCYILDLVGC